MARGYPILHLAPARSGRPLAAERTELSAARAQTALAALLEDQQGLFAHAAQVFPQGGQGLLAQTGPNSVR